MTNYKDLEHESYVETILKNAEDEKKYGNYDYDTVSKTETINIHNKNNTSNSTYSTQYFDDNNSIVKNKFFICLGLYRIAYQMWYNSNTAYECYNKLTTIEKDNIDKYVNLNYFIELQKQSHFLKIQEISFNDNDTPQYINDTVKSINFLDVSDEFLNNIKQSTSIFQYTPINDIRKIIIDVQHMIKIHNNNRNVQRCFN